MVTSGRDDGPYEGALRSLFLRITPSLVTGRRITRGS